MRHVWESWLEFVAESKEAKAAAEKAGYDAQRAQLCLRCACVSLSIHTCAL